MESVREQLEAMAMVGWRESMPEELEALVPAEKKVTQQGRSRRARRVSQALHSLVADADDGPPLDEIESPSRSRSSSSVGPPGGANGVPKVEVSAPFAEWGGGGQKRPLHDAAALAEEVRRMKEEMEEKERAWREREEEMAGRVRDLEERVEVEVGRREEVEKREREWEVEVKEMKEKERDREMGEVEEWKGKVEALGKRLKELEEEGGEVRSALEEEKRKREEEEKRAEEAEERVRGLEEERDAVVGKVGEEGRRRAETYEADLAFERARGDKLALQVADLHHALSRRQSSSSPGPKDKVPRPARYSGPDAPLRKMADKNTFELLMDATAYRANRTEGELLDVRAQVRGWKRKAELAESAVGELETKCLRLEKELAARQEALDELVIRSDEFARAESEMEGLKSELEAVKAASAALEVEAGRVQQTLAAREAELARVERMRAEAMDQASQALMEAAASRREAEAAVEERDGMEEELVSVRVQLESARETGEAKDRELQGMAQRWRAALDAKDALVRDLDEMRVGRVELAGRVVELEGERDELGRVVRDVRVRVSQHHPQHPQHPQQRGVSHDAVEGGGVVGGYVLSPVRPRTPPGTLRTQGTPHAIHTPYAHYTPPHATPPYSTPPHSTPPHSTPPPGFMRASLSPSAPATPTAPAAPMATPTTREKYRLARQAREERCRTRQAHPTPGW